MKKLALAAAVSASALGLSAQASFADYTLNILHMNDWHSRIESNNKYESTCSAEDETEGKCFGGAARLVTAVRDQRKALEGQNVIFLNAGDNFQGSLFFSTYHGEAEGEFLNMIKPDAMTIGNHEFDEGEDSLAKFIDMADFPIISANVRPDMQSKLADKVKPYVVLEVGGQKIGVVGAVANDTDVLSSPGEHVEIADDAEKIGESVKELVGMGIDKIIALTHVGYPRDMAVIAKIPGVDVVVGGHSHSLLSNTVEGAAGPYPTWVENPDGYKVPIVQAGSYSKYLGDVKVTFGDDGVVKDASGEPILLDSSVKPDEAVLARIKELGAPIQEAMSKVVAESTGPIDGSRDTCRAMECEMGDLVTDAMLDRVKDQGVQFAITNGGGLRASIDGGEVTMGEVVTVLPFQNTLATFELKGSDVVAALEGGLSQIEDGAGRFPQVSGLHYTFDKSVAPGEGRVSSVEVNDDGKWTPIDPDKTYLIATNNFMRGGGDGYKLFSTNAQNAYDYGPGLETVVADYLAANTPYTPKTDGRITGAKAMMDDGKKAEGEEPMKEDMAATETETPVTPELPEGSMTLANEPPMVPKETMAAKEPMKEDVTKPDAKTDDGAMKDDSAAKTEMAMKADDGKMAMMPENGMYTVVAGDSLWNLAKKFYGEGSKWPMIRDANPGIKANDLSIGASLKIPAAN